MSGTARNKKQWISPLCNTKRHRCPLGGWVRKTEVTVLFKRYWRVGLKWFGQISKDVVKGTVEAKQSFNYSGDVSLAECKRLAWWARHWQHLNILCLLSSAATGHHVICQGSTVSTTAEGTGEVVRNSGLIQAWPLDYSPNLTLLRT